MLSMAILSKPMEDINTILADLREYRHRFAEKYEEVYGEPFDHAVLRAKQMTKYKPSHAVQDFFEDYQNKIKHIKDLIER